MNFLEAEKILIYDKRQMLGGHNYSAYCRNGISRAVIVLLERRVIKVFLHIDFAIRPYIPDVV